jgi:anti-sigma factor RsiW
MQMHHEDAIPTQAAERYLLGEMSPEEREVYEDHCFTCEACGNELATTAAFVANARVVLASPEPAGADLRNQSARIVQPAGDSWWERFLSRSQALVPALAAAVVVLAAVVSYQGLAVIPDLRARLAGGQAAQAVPTVALRSAARGAGPRLQVSGADTFAVLQADVLPERAVARYTAVLNTADGREQFRTSLDAPAIGMPVTLLIPVRDLPPGEHTLVFQDDSNGGEVGRFTFTLDRQ